jgi:hypothetical protein
MAESQLDIGPSTIIRGEVSAEEDLLIDGYVKARCGSPSTN